MSLLPAIRQLGLFTAAAVSLAKLGFFARYDLSGTLRGWSLLLLDYFQLSLAPQKDLRLQIIVDLFRLQLTLLQSLFGVEEVLLVGHLSICLLSLLI